MINTLSPFKLTTHIHGRTRILAGSLILMVLLNIGILTAHIRLAGNLEKPRVVLPGSNGVLLPLASSAFVWTPEVACDYVKLFLPVLFTFSPEGTPPGEVWRPFINTQLIETAQKRFKLNQTLIESDGLHQTLKISTVSYFPESETAEVTGELRIINRLGEVSTQPVELSVFLTTTSDPLNPYGHTITDVSSFN
jgi:hypothetical protein